MRKNSAADAFDLNIVGTTIANMKVFGADGACVSQTNHRNIIHFYQRISTTVSELRLLNVSEWLYVGFGEATTIFRGVCGTSGLSGPKVIEKVHPCRHIRLVLLDILRTTVALLQPLPDRRKPLIFTTRGISYQDGLEDDPYTE
ncbi:hypothetical protein BLNAU_21676 [Blattamonas nauphoetae]|uniref:Uncharacterized protein n=1 Tax=Blattamonas nauphoetae TaxID=2049346 RepID=A0ABQ9WWB4_9EUKA|nr:hypothetical protein BLNAU_21676 [Blattamonas nauphoetae]